MAKRPAKDTIRAGSGNVFADLKHPHPQEALAKAEIARHIAGVIAASGLTQTEAADLLDVDQPKVSNLLRGRLSGFSTERLLRFVTALGRDVDIAIKSKPRSNVRGRIRVLNRTRSRTG